jgi:enoyl-CoA hydratase/carnithine racemase
MSLVRHERHGPVALITLDHPPLNVLSAEVVADLDTVVTAAAEPDVRAVVITGAPHFAAGADITGFQEAFDAGSPDALANLLSRLVRRIEELAKPVIAAVHGYALGGGLELAMGADFIYLADDAKVGQPEIKLGLIPGAGGTQRLYRLVGFTLAKDLVMSGRSIDATEAATAGLASKVVPSAELLDTAMADAAVWAEGPTAALGAAKRAMNEGWGRPIDDALAMEQDGFAACFTTEDAREGVAAFLDKRAATFTGR